MCVITQHLDTHQYDPYKRICNAGFRAWNSHVAMEKKRRKKNVHQPSNQSRPARERCTKDLVIADLGPYATGKVARSPKAHVLEQLLIMQDMQQWTQGI